MTELKLWNTLTRKKEVFTPIDPDNVRMYVCGPTVYDFAHIGNARPVIVFDVLNRLLRHIYGQDKVTYVRNITDVDDKINARALRDFGPEIAAGTLSLNDAIRRVTEKTANQFQKDAEALGCLAPNFQPRATEHIEGMVAMAQQLIDKGHAYVASGKEGREVLFDVASMPEYGKLSNRKIEDQQAGARVAVEAHKKNPGDFVLWKESTGDLPGWPAHFHFKGDHIDIFGRPGWHIECSVMSEHHLGKTFDIHGGGLDLIFPHHENEIAQSCCAHGTNAMANYWMHNGFLQLEGKKMSKSDGNFVTIDELLNTTKFGGRMWAGPVLKLAMLMKDYKEPLDFNAGSALYAFADLAVASRVIQSVRAPEDDEDDFFDEMWSTPAVPSERVITYLLEDLDTRSALLDIIHRIKNLEKNDHVATRQIVHDLRFFGLIDKRTLPSLSGSVSSMQWGEAPPNLVNQALALVSIKKIAAINKNDSLVADLNHQLVGLGFEESPYSQGSFDLQYVGNAHGGFESQITSRLNALAAKNFAEADRIRDELSAQGIQLMDYKDAETGEKRTKWEVKR